MADRSGRRDMMPEETGKKRRSSVIVCLPEGVSGGDWFRTDDGNGMEFAFQLPEGVMGGQKVEVEVPREEKAQVVKVRVPQGARPGDIIKAYTREGVKFKIAVPEGKGPGDIIRASVPLPDDDRDAGVDTHGMIEKDTGREEERIQPRASASTLSPPQPRGGSPNVDDRDGNESPAPPPRRSLASSVAKSLATDANRAISESSVRSSAMRLHQEEEKGPNAASYDGGEPVCQRRRESQVEIGGDFTPEQTRARNARRGTMLATEVGLSQEEEARMKLRSRRRSSIEILGELMQGMTPVAVPAPVENEGAGAAIDLHQAIAKDRRRRSSVMGESLASFATNTETSGAWPLERVAAGPAPGSGASPADHMRAFASERRQLMETQSDGTLAGTWQGERSSGSEAESPGKVSSFEAAWSSSPVQRSKEPSAEARGGDGNATGRRRSSVQIIAAKYEQQGR